MLMMKFSGVESSVCFSVLFCFMAFSQQPVNNNPKAKSLYKHIVCLSIVLYVSYFHVLQLLTLFLLLLFLTTIDYCIYILFQTETVHPANSALAPFSFSHLFSNISVYPFPPRFFPDTDPFVFCGKSPLLRALASVKN